MDNDLSNIEVPAQQSNYMKLKPGENRFRMLGKPVVGWEWWEEKTPIRKRYDEQFVKPNINESKIKYFWAFPVLDYSDNNIKILELRQRSVIREIHGLSRDKDWGSPIGEDGYDIVVERIGEDLETKYSTHPKPHKKLEKGVMKLYQDMHINLEALFDGENPFEEEAKVDLDKINFGNYPFTTGK